MFESNFSEHFDVNAQVLRKSGRIWLQIIMTHDWILSAQEHKG
jgi:hypothetical protein